MSLSLPRVVVLGGGMAGVTAAWELSRPGWRDRFESITVYERSHALGGKGASVRAPDGRILEHGLHVWLGYYDNAFRLLRECYGELGRSWFDAFVPSPEVGVFEHVDGKVVPWVARFSTNELVPGTDGPGDDLAGLVRRGAALVADLLRSSRDRPGARVGTVVDLVGTVLRGVAADGLLRGDGGFDRVDVEDFRDWLRRHGAREATVEGGLVRGMYDLTFAYRGGDRSQPAFAAGLGVYLAVRMFLGYKGSIFWKMTAGMGDVVFAPLHDALTARGVEIRYLHRLDALRLDADSDALSSVSLVATEPDGYEPLVDVDGTRCFPSAPTSPPSPSRPIELRVGTDGDVDAVVLAVSIGALPSVAADVLERRPEWRAMVEHVRTVGTRSVQLWFGPDEQELGWRHPGATLAGLDAELDTCASMSHLLPVEGGRAGALAYLCSALPDGAGPPDPAAFVAEWGPSLWPNLRAGDVVGSYAVANTDPSDRYVQSLPGSGRYRLRADASGIGGLTLAGDWIDSGIGAGCIEAAAVSGIEAANAVAGRSPRDRVLGPLTWDFT